MSGSPIDLLAILDLETIEPHLFRGISSNSGLRTLFGGQLIGQSLMAAFHTIEGRMVHSLHGYFLRAGDPQAPISYEVESLRDSKRYSTRQVTARQHSHAIFSTMISFHVGEQSAFEHQNAMPDVPPPDKLTAELSKQPMFAELPERIRNWYGSERLIELPDRPIELRPVETSQFIGRKIDDGYIHYWIKPAAKLPADPILHVCALAYASDWSLLDAVAARHGRTLFDERLALVSLDHAMWFHRPFRADDWLLYAKESPSAQAGRGLTRGLIFKPDGTLVASVAQEGSVRERR
ncbi:acyl-CoA thioesterase domain-containing protein [Bradyrhizobium uaiense]|uniref:Acyl-CoA thioesterase 2 n=1 Tax=Bradyrhizobium uaiense TaxID=2594946 RepID=A0A6P1BVL0_9BRAD|nr:acyl-CoA thioesterase II [Bradyrhizobium uaiense]